MSDAIKIFIKNFFHSLSVNIVTIMVSSFVVFIIPKVLGEESYGYWQLYIFYSSYVGLLHLGVNDGIYLRYGGHSYDELDKKVFFSQFCLLIIMQLTIITFVFIISKVFLNLGKEQLFLVSSLLTCMLIMNVSTFIQFILQATNRIKDYARINIIGRLFYLFQIIIMLIMGIKNYKIIIFLDLLSLSVSLCLGIYYCKDLIWHSLSFFELHIIEFIENIRIGSKLLLANIMGLLIIGSVRIGIERAWDITTFGKVSLTLNISNLMLVFINAIGVILYPLLRRTDRDKLSTLYISIRNICIPLLLLVLLIYYPIKIILTAWLPRYTDSLHYMGLIFPLIIYESKMSLLINPYLKTFRKEKFIFAINLVTLLISLLFTYLTTILFKNINLAVLTILLVLCFRSILSEIILSKLLKISIIKDSVLEVTLTLIFVFSAWYVNSWMTTIIYGLFYVLYFIIKLKDIKIIIKFLKTLR